MDLSIIIVNYNLGREINECLKSFQKLVINLSFEIIIVDNCSGKNEKEYLIQLQKELAKEINNLHFYYLDKNIGFGGANNFGYNISIGKYICFLNPDTFLIENIFPTLLNIFDNNKDVGILGPKIINGNGQQEKSFGFFPNILTEMLNIFYLLPKIEMLWMNKNTKLNSKDFVNVNWVTGSALLIRRNIFEEISGFDVSFFMYSEEIDLCKRVSEKKYLIGFVPDVKIIHLKSVSSKKDYFFFTKVSYESKLVYIKKHFNGFNAIIIRATVILQIIIQVILWMLLFPLNKNKSINKLKAFPNLLLSFLSK